MSYPRQLSYYLNKLNGLSRNTVKLFPSTPTTNVRNNDIIRVLLPQNTIVDLRSFVMNFLGSTTTTAGNAAFPKHIESILDSVHLEVNGAPVSPSSQFQNIPFKIMADYTLRDRESARFLQGGASVAAGFTNQTNVRYSIFNFLGFLSTAEPRLVDTSIIGDCHVVLRLASPNILVKDATCAGEGFSLNSLDFSIDIYSLDDGGYYSSMIQKRLETGVIEIPFKYWLSFVGSPGQTRIQGTVSTQSLNLVILTTQPSSFGGTANLNTTTGSSDYFTRGHSSITTSQVFVNNIAYPQYPTPMFEAYYHSLKALNIHLDTLGWVDTGLNSLANFTNNYMTHIQRFSMPSSGDERLQSGIDTRGTMGVIRGEFNTSATNITPVLLCECNGTLVVGAGRQVNSVW